MTGSLNESWPAVFLDRDGTLMRDVDYCGDPANVEVYPEASEALRRLKEKGYKLVIITNQSGIGRRIRAVSAAAILARMSIAPSKPNS